MPLLEQGDIAGVAENARKVTSELLPWVEKGYDIVALVPSCALMLKFEWPLILPGDETVRKIAGATFDSAEYVVDIARKHGLAEGLRPLEGGVTVHLACHARAQNMGPKAAEMLRLIPEPDVAVIERCSGHGGSWGMLKDNFEVALKVGKPVAQNAVEKSGGVEIAEKVPTEEEYGIAVAQGETKKIVLSKDCEIKVRNSGKNTVEVQLYGKGECVGKISQALPKDELLFMGGNAVNFTAWFVVLRQSD